MDDNIFAKYGAPGFDSPTAFRYPFPSPIMVGLGYPSHGSLLSDFVTSAPAPSFYRRPKTSSDIPRMPDASIVGLSSTMGPTLVEMSGLTSNNKKWLSYNV